MLYNIEYPIAFSALKNLIEDEVSKIAAASYSEQGVSLYDAIKIYHGDTPQIEGYISDAIHDIKNEFDEFSLIVLSNNTDTEDGATLKFSFPDFDEENKPSLLKEISRFISMSVTANWIYHKRGLPDVAQEYVQRRDSSLKRVSLLLRTRKRPTR